MNGWNLVPGYKNIGTKEDVCGGDPTIIGTRLEPIFIASYGLDTIEDFGITKEQYEEAVKWIVQEIKRLQAEQNKLIEALKFYANEDNWRSGFVLGLAQADGGERAQAILDEIGVTVEWKKSANDMQQEIEQYKQFEQQYNEFIKSWEKYQQERDKLIEGLRKLAKTNAENISEIREWKAKQNDPEVIDLDWYNYVARDILKEIGVTVE